MSTQPYEGTDERDYLTPEARLEDKPGYPWNTSRGDPTRARLSDEAQDIGADAEDDVFTPLTGQNAAKRLLERLEPNEPVFVLRGNDITAAIIVRMWCGLNALNPQMRPHKLRKARRIGLAMDRWSKRVWPT